MKKQYVYNPIKELIKQFNVEIRWKNKWYDEELQLLMSVGKGFLNERFYNFGKLENRNWFKMNKDKIDYSEVFFKYDDDGEYSNYKVDENRVNEIFKNLYIIKDLMLELSHFKHSLHKELDIISNRHNYSNKKNIPQPNSGKESKE